MNNFFAWKKLDVVPGHTVLANQLEQGIPARHFTERNRSIAQKFRISYGHMREVLYCHHAWLGIIKISDNWNKSKYPVKCLAPMHLAKSRTDTTVICQSFRKVC